MISLSSNVCEFTFLPSCVISQCLYTAPLTPVHLTSIREYILSYQVESTHKRKYPLFFPASNKNLLAGKISKVARESSLRLTRFIWALVLQLFMKYPLKLETWLLLQNFIQQNFILSLLIFFSTSLSPED